MPRVHDPSSYVGQEEGWCLCDQPSGHPGSSCEACGGAILEPIDRMKRHVGEELIFHWSYSSSLTLQSSDE